MDTSVHPPIVHAFGELTEVTFHETTVSPSDNYRGFYPNQALPELNWMKVHGIAGQDDFGIVKDLRLVVSRDAELVLQGFNLSFATFEEYP